MVLLVVHLVLARFSLPVAKVLLVRTVMAV